MPITTTATGAIRNPGPSLNGRQRRDANDAIDAVQLADVFRSGHRLANTDTMRIDNQGNTSAGIANVQLQINGIRGNSTVAAILVAPSLVPNGATAGQQLAAITAIRAALGTSLTSGQIQSLTGTP